MKKLSTRITIFVVIATVIGILIQSVLASVNMRSIMASEAEKELENKILSVTAQLDSYIEKQFAYIDGFMASDVMKELVENPNDPEIRSAAQKFTQEYQKVVPNSKSVFYTEYNGEVLTQTQDVSIDIERLAKNSRENAESLKEVIDSFKVLDV